jgi:penicillin amidase
MRILRKAALAGLLLAILASAGIWLTLRASLPRLDGTVALAGLEDPVRASRDRLGVVTLRGRTRADLARATGFIHAQERFFQMDLSRRRAAGELSVLFGEVALKADRGYRLHRFRYRARQILEQADPTDAALLTAYADGVNAGLGDLAARPWEYFLLGAVPEPWRAEDSVLVLYSMFLELNDSRGDRDSGFDLLDRTLPPELVAFISPTGTGWDAPMEGGAYPSPPIPAPDVFSVDRDPDAAVAFSAAQAAYEEGLPGSNNWAVAGSVSADGGAIVANDMHLTLRVPNTFFRLRLESSGDDALAITGVTLPGAPHMVAGSNGRVAWGFTNSYGDWTDVVLLETDPQDRSRYRTADGWRTMECVDEIIEIAGGHTEVETVCNTIWGPRLPDDDLGRSRVLSWIAHRPEAVSPVLRGMETARDLEAALEVANRVGIPPQNIVVADASGRIGWTIAGRIPLRAGYDPNRPASWVKPGTGWVGWLAPEDYPRIVDPRDGRLWTANARVADGRNLALIGDGGYALGARAMQIRDALRAGDELTIAGMLDIQLDDRALFLERWRSLAVDTARAAAPTPAREEFRMLLENWEPRASASSVGYRLAHEFRGRVLAVVFEGLTGPVREAEPGFGLKEGFRYGVGRQFEGPAWRLVSERPDHLLHPAYSGWDELLLAAVDQTIESVTAGGDMAGQTWGRINVAAIRHPLSGAIPGLSYLLDMPAEALDGATHMPRVQQASFGASERFAVSPGREEEGYFHMPTGQSGHPLSPFYRAGHAAWVGGEPTPFLPGATIHEIRFSPDSG